MHNSRESLIKFPRKELSSYRWSRSLRCMAVGWVLAGFFQGLSSLVLDFWQMGPCDVSCHWKSGLPWSTHNGHVGWIFTLIFGVIGVIAALIAFILGMIEVCALRFQFGSKITLAIIGCTAIALACLLLNWILYLFLSWPLGQGYLVFSFAFMVIATIMLIFAVIAYTCAYRFSQKYYKTRSYY